MTPEEFQRELDRLDERLGAGENPVPEGAAQENKVLAFAVEAIRFDALSRRVRKALDGARAQMALDGARAHQALDGAPAAQPLDSASASQPPPPQKREAPVRRLAVISLSVAAGIALILCVGKYLLTTPTGMYDKMYTSYDMGTTRGGEELAPLEHAYQSKAWSAVDDIFRVKAFPTPEDRFLAGMAFMEQGQYAPAINQFRTVGRLGTDYRDESEYYLALAYLASHQTDSALLLFQKIKTDPEHLFYRKVKEINGVDLLILRTK
ncbi:tetratricopeptide repeat protein [Dinghuibacter silviterrae]|uniref:Tetratricopeptide repeat protein n=1 Tax=Dinghuibacter silviterrae TaxID=1539049 RepID=A0A4R8DH57_9BACT|nr:hypothetical protein [Dinghuibacter silviterrae]TDW97033.1 hypothetical protein EDB95_4870 [Dinghuibacter silviterrae]